MAEFEVKVSINFGDEKGIDTIINEIMKKYFKGEMVPELTKLLRKVLFLKGKITDNIDFYSFIKNKAGMFPKLLLENTRVINNDISKVSYRETDKHESIQLQLSVDKESQKELIEYPENVIMKRLTGLDGNATKQKFNTTIKRGDFKK